VPVDRDKVLQAAQKLVERKRFDKAIIEYQRLVAEDPKDVRTLLKIGDLYLKTEEYVEAITTYERVGEFYSSQGFALKAIAVYKQIREIINKYVPHLSDRFGHIVPRLAEIYAQLGLTSDALAAYDEVATRYQKAGRERDAIDVFRKIVDLDPNNPLPHLRLAEALVRVKDHDAAIQRFGNAAEILLKLGRRDDALKVVERLLQHRQDARFARMAAEIYLDRRDPNDGMAALAKLQVAFKENPKDLQTLMLLARAFDRLERPSQAIEVLKESARIAKEAQRVDQFAAIVSSLLARAPNDEAVKQLAAQLGPASGAAIADPRASIDVVVEDDADADANADEEVELDATDLQESIPPSAAPIPLPEHKSHVALDSYDPGSPARQIIVEADSYLRARHIDRAIATLRRGVQHQPESRELRQRLCDVLFDAGDQDGAIIEMIAVAQLLAGEGDVDGAARKLDEVLLIEPGHPRATEMLGLLGYSVQPEQYVETDVQGDYAQTYASAPPIEPEYDPSAPLPSYDPEDQGNVAQALSQRYSRQSALPQPGFGIDALDDPFTSEPLPQFPLEDEATSFMQPVPSQPQPYARSTPAPMAAVRPGAPSPSQARPSVQPHAHHFAPPSAPIPSPAPSSRAEALDEEALDEVDFFSQNGMFDEARAILQEQLSRLPNHPLLLERLSEVEALEAQQLGGAENQSGTRAVPRGEEIAEDRAFDIALQFIDEIEMPAAQAAPLDDLQVSAESVFEEFKKGVAAQVSESDAATHYDLGVAYREMGLLPDAIKEFELAARDPSRECVCQSMIGMIHLQTGNSDAAIDAFILGLRATQKTVEQELALNYEIASAYEARGDRDQALYYFQRVSRLNPSYSDPRGTVADRLRRLELLKPAARAAVGAELLGDDFDAAFDDLLSRSKLP